MLFAATQCACPWDILLKRSRPRPLLGIAAHYSIYSQDLSSFALIAYTYSTCVTQHGIELLQQVSAKRHGASRLFLRFGVPNNEPDAISIDLFPSAQASTQANHCLSCRVAEVCSLPYARERNPIIHALDPDASDKLHKSVSPPCQQRPPRTTRCRTLFRRLLWLNMRGSTRDNACALLATTEDQQSALCSSIRLYANTLMTLYNLKAAFSHR